ncbi:Uric acid degradation bifunctional protein PucL [Enhygromyxa salina]|uniref:2-oxo-4-hydroxy-4-carboxy-5-ureidoimidazoline decarboxylase n=1 Tax=Enhygromyxa salina TaxID=215803 RepID=A0A2S9Y4I1_9BACT|nr:2-oxo-4-hydroxy-4-carboxy-5-ureidoimidazoline decarboxylase [Enhygromyxa salina]PRQ00010.1 Uric acid degradation bifunctional protein PucL [Enhygromyxa salina]
MSAAQALDALAEPEARAALTRCCGASRWVAGMLARRPFGDDAALHRCAREVWATMTRDDILEAFEHHPRIGANLDALRKKFSATASLSIREQAGAIGASEAELERLRDGNLAYEARYGHIFIVSAAGKTAAQIADLLEARMANPAEDELRIAAAEQAKITHARLETIAT